MILWLSWPPGATRRSAVVVLCAVLIALLPRGTRAHAQSSVTLPSAHDVALARSAFPAHSRITGKPVGNRAADAISGLHTVSYAALDRVTGYVQTATWRPTTRAQDSMTLQYHASIFPSAGSATAAYGDGVASLWELGHPMRIATVDDLAFKVRERGHMQIDIVTHRSLLAVELRLRYSTSAMAAAAGKGMAALQHLAGASARQSARIAQTFPAPSTPGTPPPLYVAPWGTGPIVKSPSLMTISGTSLNLKVPTDPGAFRNDEAPALASHASAAISLVPPGGMSRFVRTVDDPVGPAQWYDSATLYGNAGAAQAALQALDRANRKRPGVQVAVPPGDFPGVTELAGWQAGGEKVVAVRIENFVAVLAGSPASDDALTNVVHRVLDNVPSWLHADGTAIVDAAGQPVHLSALNWYGAEQQDFVVGGLDFQSYQSILQTVSALGYNTIRLPFSDQLVEQNPIVTSHVRANPELAGMRALDIMDRIISYAGALGLSVILDNHRSEAGWSSEDNGLWYTAQYPDSAFVADWSTMAARYEVNNVVIGADLRNEPHASASWGDGNLGTDWHAAAQRAGNAVLAANPHLLVMVEGVQFYGGAVSAWWGENLMGVAAAPVVLQFPDGSSARSQLVYSAHDYGPDMCGRGCPWFDSTTTYGSLSQVWDQYWGYIAADPTKSYAAPVWIGEFGTCNYRQTCVADTTPGSQGQWFSSLVRYLGERQLSWSYWSVNGTQSTGGERVYGTTDWYGLLQPNWSQPVPWLLDALQSLQHETAGVPTSPPFTGQHGT